MRRLIYLTSALDDLADILRYVTRESTSLEIGRAFVGKLRRRVETLATLPGKMGTARPELLPDIRSIAHGRYVIFFRYRDDRLEVVNILAGARDIEGYFNDLPPH